MAIVTSDLTFIFQVPVWPSYLLAAQPRYLHWAVCLAQCAQHAEGHLSQHAGLVQG